MITSLLSAAEDGNLEAIEELTNSSTHFDVGIANRVSIRKNLCLGGLPEQNFLFGLNDLCSH